LANINLYVISNDTSGKLTAANDTIKNNLKTYLSRFKMINDTIDILDAKVINLQIEFKIITYNDVDKFSALESAKSNLAAFFARRKNFEIGESFLLSDVYNVLKNTPMVLDVVEVDVSTKVGALYADTNFQAAATLRKDRTGRKIMCPPDSIFEIRFPNSDIIGTIQ